MNTQDRDNLRLGIPSDLSDAAKLCEAAAGIVCGELRDEMMSKAIGILSDAKGNLLFIRSKDRKHETESKEGNT